MAITKISDNGINLIKRFEGCRLDAYKDSVGVVTIGYGHTGGLSMGMHITQAQADAYLRSDLEKFERRVTKYENKYHWTQNQFDAMVSFAYNLGSIDKLTANGTRSIAEISNKILAYDKAGGRVLAGLTRRRKAEKELFDKDGVATTPVAPTTAPTRTVILPHGVLKKGCKGTDVKNLQNAINVISGVKQLVEDGDYGNNTVVVMKKIQSLIGTTQDGIYGEKTRKAMETAAIGQGITVN